MVPDPASTSEAERRGISCWTVPSGSRSRGVGAALPLIRTTRTRRAWGQKGNAGIVATSLSDAILDGSNRQPGKILRAQSGYQQSLAQRARAAHGTGRCRLSAVAGAPAPACRADSAG